VRIVLHELDERHGLLLRRMVSAMCAVFNNGACVKLSHEGFFLRPFPRGESRKVLKFKKVGNTRQHPRQGCSFTYQLKYWWGTYHFKNTYSPITLANISFINVVSIFRCSSFKSNPVYARHVDSSALVFSLSSHRHSYIGLVFSSRFID
jgi:hypothetical protein